MAKVAFVIGLIVATFSPDLISAKYGPNSGDDNDFTNREPVVLTGLELPELLGENPDDIIAFKFDPTSEPPLHPIPVQVDERHEQDWEQIKHGDCRTVGRGVKHLVYSDPKTYTGSDPDPSFDDDDELVFMAKNLGERAVRGSFRLPDHFKQDKFVEVGVADPLEEDTIIGYAYIVVEEEKMENVRPREALRYSFSLNKTDSETGSNDYFDVYKFMCDSNPDNIQCKPEETMNPENSLFSSSVFERHFSENWHSDSVRIRDGINFWGMEEFQFGKDTCERCTVTFTHGPTAFITNKVGPVRVIRSWVGANSGVITQRETILYEEKEVQTTNLRVHPIPGFFGYLNFQEGREMMYFDCRNRKGFKIDGKMSEDELNYDNQFCPWSLVTSPESGTFFRSVTFEQDSVPDISQVMEAWYYDNKEPEEILDDGVPVYENGLHLCTAKSDGQVAAWGTFGFKIKDGFASRIPNTDPLRLVDQADLPCQTSGFSELGHLSVIASQYYLPSDFDVSLAPKLDERASAKLYRSFW